MNSQDVSQAQKSKVSQSSNGDHHINSTLCFVDCHKPMKLHSLLPQVSNSSVSVPGRNKTGKLVDPNHQLISQWEFPPSREETAQLPMKTKETKPPVFRAIPVASTYWVYRGGLPGILTFGVGWGGVGMIPFLAIAHISVLRN